MRTEFKNRGHFCNYCRKIIYNKQRPFHAHTINQVIWYIWDQHDEALTQKFLADLVALTPMEPERKFNNQLRRIKKRYLGDRDYKKVT